MYTSILVPTAGSELAEKAVRMAPARYQARLQKHAVKILAVVSHSAQAAGVACEMVLVEHEHPYQAIPIPEGRKAVT
jgi:hypothetical protein